MFINQRILWFVKIWSNSQVNTRYINRDTFKTGLIIYNFVKTSKMLWSIDAYIDSTGPKMFWASPNVLCQTKNWIAFSATPKDFVLVLKLNLLNINHLLFWHKRFVTGTICKSILFWQKKNWTSTNYFGTCKRTRH